MPAVIQIVDQVGASGQVLLDLNRHVGGILLGARDQVKLADVEMQQRSGDQPFAWSPAPDGGAPAQLASRQIVVPVVLTSASADQTAGLVRQLQQLTRSRFVLKVQRHGSSTPVWFRCGPCVPRLDTQVAAAGQPTRLVTGTLTAATDPYAIGARVDVGPVTITQDPSSGTPFIWDINSVGGDSLTPLVLRSADTDLIGSIDRTLISIRRRGVPSDLAGLFVQGEACTVTPGATPPTLSTVTGDSALSGGSGARATYGAGASGPWTAAATFTGLTGVEVPGLYRLLVRCRRAGGAAGALFSLIATVGRSRQVETFTAAGNDTRIIDLGIVQVPVGQPPFMGAPETPVAAAAPTVYVTVVRAAEGTGTLDVDWVGLIPADQDAGVLEVAQTTTGVLAVDGWDMQPRVYTDDPYTGTSPAAVGAAGIGFVGGMPRLRPGNNRLYLVGGLGTAAASSRSPSLALTVSGSYWPRTGWLA